MNPSGKVLFVCCSTSFDYFSHSDHYDLLGLSEEIDVDFNGDGDVSSEGGSGLTIFSVRNLVAFFTFWLEWLVDAFNRPYRVLDHHFSILIGLCFLFVSAGLFYGVSKMQSSGNFVIKNAIGLVGDVYIPIPPSRKGNGKIMLKVQGSLRELEACTDDTEMIPRGIQVKVLSCVNESKLVVTKEILD